jgi:hypothetical protein
MSRALNTPQIKLELEKKILALVAQAYRIVATMTANVAIFASPLPTLAAVTAAASALQQAQTLALTRVAGAVTARGLKEVALRNLLKELAAYVVSIAHNNPSEAANIFAAAGWSEKAVGKHVKLPLKVTSLTAGLAHLVATAGPKGKKVFYNWRYTVDGGKTLTAAPGTNDAETTITGLPSGVLVGFEYSMTIKNVTGAWSQTVTVTVK